MKEVSNTSSTRSYEFSMISKYFFIDWSPINCYRSVILTIEFVKYVFLSNLAVTMFDCLICVSKIPCKCLSHFYQSPVYSSGFHSKHPCLVGVFLLIFFESCKLITFVIKQREFWFFKCIFKPFDEISSNPIHWYYDEFLFDLFLLLLMTEQFT